MLNSKFLNTPAEEITDAIRRHGYWSVDEALAPKFVDDLLREIDFEAYQVNANTVGVVSAGNQRFLSHCLAASKKAYDVITSERVLEICQDYFNGPFKLTNQRIYQTHTEAHMPWHTDNNCQSGNTLTGKHQLPGLLFLIYLSDVTENAFQLLRDSHQWSQKHTDNYFSDDFIESNHADEILTFQARRGALYACDIHAVHRAAPFNHRGYSRFTLLFQVDAVSEDYVGHGEQLLVNTAFVDRRDTQVLDYLGFGIRAEYPAFPSTSAATMGPADLWKMQKKVIPLVIQACLKLALKAVIPGWLAINLKRWKWKMKNRHTDPAPKTPWAEPS